MKIKLFLIAAVIMLSAITVNGQINIGIEAGPNFQNIRGTAHNGDKLENGYLMKFHAGVELYIPVATDFYIQSGLLYSCKGAKTDFYVLPLKASDPDLTTITSLGYIELPLNLLFKPEFGNGHILIGLGPYFAVAVTGNQKYNYSSITYEQSIKFASEITSSQYSDYRYAYFKPLDAGMNFYAGYEFEMGLFFHFNAQLGLLQINPPVTDAVSDEADYKNIGFGLSLGYSF